MKFGKVILAAIVLWVLHVVWIGATDGLLFGWVYSVLPVAIWCVHVPYVLLIFLGLIFTFFFSLFYAVIMESLPGRRVGKGLTYGLFIWLVGWLPIIAFVGFMTQINDAVIIYWLVNLLVISLWQGVVVSVIYR